MYVVVDNVLGLIKSSPSHLESIDIAKITDIQQNTTSQYAVYGHFRTTSETPFKWCFAGGQIAARSNMLFRMSVQIYPPNLNKLLRLHGQMLQLLYYMEAISFK